MKFLHTADWHIGRRLFEYDLKEEQAAVFKQVIQIAQEEKVDAIIIAGDLYDRQNPSEEAVEQLDQMIKQLNLTMKLPLLVINGNHDSNIRLGIGDSWYEATNYFLRTTLESIEKPILIGDAQFFLLPYFELYQARQYFNDESIHSLAQAIKIIVTHIQTLFDPTKKHIFVGHFFAAGSEHSDSETSLTVGGLDAVSLDLLAPFDYVALGHIHNRQALQERFIRYSGSLLKFSLSEARQQKGVLIVETDPEIQVKFRAVTPLHEVQQLTGTFKELSNLDYLVAQGIDRQAYTGIVLNDTGIISDAGSILKKQFPRFLRMERKHAIVLSENDNLVNAQKKSPMEQLSQFYHLTTSRELTQQQKQLAEQLLKEVQSN